MRHAFRHILAWGLLAAIVFVTYSPVSLRPHFMEVQSERFWAWAVCGALFALAYPKRPILILAALILAAVGSELAQKLDPWRHSHLRDAVAKGLGAGLGAGVAYIVLALTPAIARAANLAPARRFRR